KTNARRRHPMVYYRIALRTNESAEWRWKSTVVTSLEAIVGLIRLYRSVPRDRIRVFFSSGVELMDDMLARENEGLASNSVTAEQFLSGKTISPAEMVRLEAEAKSVLDKKVTVPATVATMSMANEKRV